MEIKDLTAILVVAMVGCILVAGFIPVVGESVSVTTTFENGGYYRMTEITAETEGEWVYSWTNDDPDVIVVNDIEYSMDVPTGLSYSVIGASDGWVSRYVNGANPYIQTMFQHGLGSGGVGMKSFDCTISGGSASFAVVLSDDSTATRTVSYTSCYVLDKNGSWIMKNKDESAFMLKDSAFFAIGVTGSAGFPLNVFEITGNIEDGATVTNPIHKAGGSDFVASNVVVHSSAVNGYNDLYALDKITFTATDGTDTINATYSYFLVPYEITAEKAIHADANTASIVSMIPFILIMGIVLMFVGVVLVRRYV